MPLFESMAVVGSPLSGKTTLAKLLAEHFNWKYFSVEEMWRVIWRKKFPKGDTSFENFIAETTDEEHREMDRNAGELLRGGHIVGDMLYAFLHRDPRLLIIYTDCSIDERVKRALGINKYPGKDFAQIKEILEQRERDDADRCTALYGSDYRDSKNYDLLFDTTNAAPDKAIEMILSLKT